MDDCYKKEAWMRAYGEIINPIKQQEEWPKSTMSPMSPPIYRIQPGRHEVGTSSGTKDGEHAKEYEVAAL
ncbi:hypothetical protein PanWU01x14_144340 [Parasponia andersonii]|uniref:Uncharacterized protein n=1 Tax=Parasponia andersonii TaxID=3476 RepID=A0A2P5CLB9_PARAD|nr:hypothetical protein PanWU01x14_144340 [Parasponia andersonii]